MVNLKAIELNIQVNSQLVDELSKAMQVADAEQFSQLVLLVKLRRLAIAEMMLDKIKDCDNRISALCAIILDS